LWLPYSVWCMAARMMAWPVFACYACGHSKCNTCCQTPSRGAWVQDLGKKRGSI